MLDRLLSPRPATGPRGEDHLAETDAVLNTFYALKFVFRHIGKCVKLMLVCGIFSLPLITAPAAWYAMYAVLADLRAGKDPDDISVIHDVNGHIRRSFWSSLLLAVSNVALVVILVFAFFYWTDRDSLASWTLAFVVLPFVVLWWACQPILLPTMLQMPAKRIIETWKIVVGLVMTNVWYSMQIAGMATLLILIGIVSLGPLLFFVIPTICVIGIDFVNQRNSEPG